MGLQREAMLESECLPALCSRGPSVLSDDRSHSIESERLRDKPSSGSLSFLQGGYTNIDCGFNRERAFWVSDSGSNRPHRA